jgi:hypothetical protein
LRVESLRLANALWLCALYFGSCPAAAAAVAAAVCSLHVSGRGGHALDCVREAVCFRAPPPQTTSTVHLGILPRPDSLLACPRCRDPWRHESGWTRHRHGSPLRACYMPCRCR